MTKRAYLGYARAAITGAAIGLVAFALANEVGPRLARRMMRH